MTQQVEKDKFSYCVMSNNNKVCVFLQTFNEINYSDYKKTVFEYAQIIIIINMALPIPLSNAQSRYLPCQESLENPSYPIQSHKQIKQLKVQKHQIIDIRSGKFLSKYGGPLHRNDVGWDGVKQTQNVIQRARKNNYSDNQRIIEKFRLEALQEKRKEKFKHVLQNKQSQINHHHSFELPSIASGTTATKMSAPSMQFHHSPPPHIQENQQQQQEEEDGDDKIHCRNVGVNTNKQYQISQLQKYMKLRQKYDRLKSKYKLLKKREPKMKTDISQDRITERRRKYQNETKTFDEIEKQLAGITVKINQNKQSLIMKNSKLTDNRETQSDQETNMHERQETNGSIIQNHVFENSNNNFQEEKQIRKKNHKKIFTEPNYVEADSSKNFISEISTKKNVEKTPKILYSSNGRNRSAELQRLNQKIFRGNFRVKKY